MNIRVHKDRYLIKDSNNFGTQYENLATTLQFEFPEFIEKNGIKIATKNLNKYIVFDINSEENQDLIIDNKYSIPYEITKQGEITFLVKMIEASDFEDITDKLIWNSQKMTIRFNKAFEGNTNVTNEKLDAFNSVVTTLNQKTIEVDMTIEEVERKVENGDFNGENGLTPYILNGYWYIGKENTGILAKGISIIKIEKTNTINNIDEYTIYFSDTTTFKYQVINGQDYIITENDKNEMVNDVKKDIRPILDDANNTAKEAVSIAKGANQSKGFKDYEEVVTIFNDLSVDTYRIGQNIYVKTRFVPDLWVYEVFEENIPYTYTNDEEFINIINSSEGIRIGYYSLAALETQKVDLEEYLKEKDLQDKVLNLTYSKDEIDEQIGDISSILDLINGEVI